MARSKKKLEKEALQAYMRALRKEYASTLKYPVRVRLRKAGGHHGDSDFKNGWYLIRIDPGNTFQERIEVLCHEWSHILDYDRNGVRVAKRDQHNPERWGPIYAEVLNVKDRITEELYAQWNITEERNG